MKFPLGSIAKNLIVYLSDIVDKFTPDTITDETKATVQNYVASFYAIAKNFGYDLVEKSENDLDDKILDEFIEICEKAAEKYDLELNPKNI